MEEGVGGFAEAGKVAEAEIAFGAVAVEAGQIVAEPALNIPELEGLGWKENMSEVAAAGTEEVAHTAPVAVDCFLVPGIQMAGIGVQGGAALGFGTGELTVPALDSGDGELPHTPVAVAVAAEPRGLDRQQLETVAEVGEPGAVGFGSWAGLGAESLGARRNLGVAGLKGEVGSGLEGAVPLVARRNLRLVDPDSEGELPVPDVQKEAPRFAEEGRHTGLVEAWDEVRSAVAIDWAVAEEMAAGSVGTLEVGAAGIGAVVHQGAAAAVAAAVEVEAEVGAAIEAAVLPLNRPKLIHNLGTELHMGVRFVVGAAAAKSAVAVAGTAGIAALVGIQPGGEGGDYGGEDAVGAEIEVEVAEGPHIGAEVAEGAHIGAAVQKTVLEFALRKSPAERRSEPVSVESLRSRIAGRRAAAAAVLVAVLVGMIGRSSFGTHLGAGCFGAGIAAEEGEQVQVEGAVRFWRFAGQILVGTAAAGGAAGFVQEVGGN